MLSRHEFNIDHLHHGTAENAEPTISAVAEIIDWKEINLHIIF